MRLWILEFIIQLNQCLHLATAGLLSQPAWDAVVGKVLEGHFWVGEMRGAGASRPLWTENKEGTSVTSE